MDDLQRSFTLYPACTEEGASFYLAQCKMKEEAEKAGQAYKMLPMPKQFIVKTESFKDNKKEKPVVKSNFKKSDIRCSKKNRKRAKKGLTNSGE